MDKGVTFISIFLLAATQTCILSAYQRHAFKRNSAMPMILFKSLAYKKINQGGDCTNCFWWEQPIDCLTNAGKHSLKIKRHRFLMSTSYTENTHQYK